MSLALCVPRYSCIVPLISDKNRMLQLAVQLNHAKLSLMLCIAEGCLTN
jgi:hypothetical protein